MKHWRPLLDAPLCLILYRHPVAITAGLYKHWKTVKKKKKRIKKQTSNNQKYQLFDDYFCFV